jgi:signal transduction histidine kinase
MNVPRDIVHFIQSLEAIDTELGFEEHVDAAARRVADFLNSSSTNRNGSATGPNITVQYEYPFLTMSETGLWGEQRSSTEIPEACIQMANCHLQLVQRERERAGRRIQEFLHPLSHYMKSPLTAILGYVSLLEDELVGTEDDEVLHFIRRIGGNSRLLVKMIDDLVYLSRLSRAHEEELSVPDIVALSMKSLENQECCSGATVTVQESLPPIRMNRDHALNLFTQLLSNACIHNDAVPVIHIGHVDSEFFVRDSGRGISQDNLVKVFRIFFTTCSKDAGRTGAGLYTVKKILELYGGNIRIESAPGSGTTVYFRTKKRA